MGGGGGGMESGEPEFQVAPMIDVLLVILIFFMSITTAQIEKLDKSIALPVAPDAKERKPDKNQRTVNVRWNKNEQKALMTFGGLEWQDREGLAEELRKIADTMPDGKGGTRLEILVRADRATPAKEVQAAIAVIAQSAAAVAYATHNR